MDIQLHDILRRKALGGSAYRSRLPFEVPWMRSRSNDAPAQGGEKYPQRPARREIIDIEIRQPSESAAVFLFLVPKSGARNLLHREFAHMYTQEIDRILQSGQVYWKT